MPVAYLSLGSNIDPVRNLSAAIAELNAHFAGVVVSKIYRTPAVGFEGADFLNAAAKVETESSPQALNAWLHALEDRHGRDRSGPRFGDRPLDIDIVLYDELMLHGEDNLCIPRTELKHAFVLKPLAEIAPEVKVPGTNSTVGELWQCHAQTAETFDTIELAADILTADTKALSLSRAHHLPR